ncbi:MAG: hypothetical protein M1840_000057 [Geoglossum simile]|nr:MAG: hypothetical protein M1840_000057 [Geoglossum simile]
MGSTEGSTFYRDCSSPVILDMDNMEILQDNDLEFFIPSATPASSSVLDDMLETAMDFDGFPQAPAYMPSAAFSPKTISNPLPHNEDNCHPTPAPSSSPTSSLQDSSSDFSRHHERKSSSNSSHSTPAAADAKMVEDTDLFGQPTMGGDEPVFAGYSDFSDISIGGPNGQLTMNADVEMSNRDMENHFDFDSAASSPNAFGATGNHHSGVSYSDFSGRKHSQASNRYHLDSQSAVVGLPSSPSTTSTLIAYQRRNPGSPGGALALHGVREDSPLSSAMTASYGASPSAVYNNHSPCPDLKAEFGGGSTLGEFSQNPVWLTTFDPTDPSAPNLNSEIQPPLSLQNSLASPFPPAKSLSRRDVTPRLIIHPMPLKSRVETQIFITITLYPIPAGVTKLHLPPHTISKPKLMEKPRPSRTPDALELHTMLVCTSAMQNPECRMRALARAAGVEIKRERVGRSPPQGGQSDLSDDEESKPLNGGEVKICTNCMTRERKRASRKKVKKVEDEEAWNRDEQKRVIVFNTREVRDWQLPTKELSIQPGDEATPSLVPAGAMQVEAPMRIACYCRHQGEKLGFQVIFTIKDHNDSVVAQAITPSIMITDDHKTHAPPQSTPPQSASPQSAPPQSAAPQSVANPPDTTHLPPDSRVFSNGQGFRVSPEDSTSMPQFRLSYSTSDLQSLPQTLPQQFPPMPTPYTAPQAYSLSHTPRNLSRQASTSGPSGPSAKKRKSSSSGKVPTGLAMTRLETQTTPHGFAHAVQSNPTPPSATSPYFPNRYNLPTESSYTQPPPNPPQFHTGPPTPNSNDYGFSTPAHRSQSMENLPVHSLFSASNSTHPSRVPSPSTGQRNNTSQLYQQAQAQMAQQVANGLYGLPLALNPHHPPVIHKLIPNEGPKAGGVEVTCLGSGFCQGLEVFFGDNPATTTTYWGDTSLVCLLPPSLRAGTVPVTFKHDQQPMHTYFPVLIPKQHVLFKYVDDDEQQLLRLALSVLGQKMTGKREDVRDIARRIVGSSGGDPWSAAGGGSSSVGGQQRPTSAFDASVLGLMDLESTLLKCLDLIDLDDSPNQARLNLRRGSGQTMLHLACSLGFYRFVAALLARGANPEPRDRGGYTPMHYAVMHNHPQIVRRLVLSGADPDTRTLRGRTAADFAASEEVLASTRRLEHRSKHRSGGSSRSRVSSAASLSSLWETTHATAAAIATSGFGGSAADSSDEHGESSDDDEIDPISDSQLWMRPKRSSRRISISTDAPKMGSDSSRGVPQPQRDGAATPAMVAWRQQLATHFQHLQQLWNLPNLPNLPQIPPMPTLPDYQNYLGNSMGRLNSLVPLRNPSRSGRSSGSETQTAKEGDYRWWELFSVPSAPPAYEEIYPQCGSETTDKKTSHVAQAAVDAFADQKCAEAFDRKTTVGSPAGGRSSPIIELRIGRGTITKEAQEELRAAHARKLKKIRSDRNLFFIWIPLLVIMLVAMLKNCVPQVWDGASKLYFYAQDDNPRRVVEVLY